MSNLLFMYIFLHGSCLYVDISIICQFQFFYWYIICSKCILYFLFPSRNIYNVCVNYLLDVYIEMIYYNKILANSEYLLLSNKL